MTRASRWPMVVGWLAVAVNVAWGAVGWQYPDQRFVGDLVHALMFSSLGALIVTAQPRNWVGLALLAPTGMSVGDALQVYAAASAGSLPGASVATAVSLLLASSSALVPITVVPFLVPNGEIPRGRWRWAFRGSLIVLLVLPMLNVLSYFAPEMPEPYWRGLNLIIPPMLLVCVVAAVWNLAERYSRSAGQQRAQMAWILLGLITYLGSLGVQVVGQSVTGGYIDGSSQYYGLFVVIQWLPTFAAAVTWGIAILRHSLLRLNPLVHRLLSLVVLAIVLTAGTLVAATVTGQVLVVEVVVSVTLGLASPALYHWLFGATASLVYGRGGSPEHAVATLIRRLARATGPDQVLGALADSVADRLPASAIDVSLFGRDGGTSRRSQRGGFGGDHSLTFPLVFEALQLGMLRVSSSRPINEAERDIVSDLVNAAAGAVAAAHRAVDLQRARENLVIIREAERRRIGRDVHDGLGPILSGLGFKTDALIEKLRGRPGDAELAGYIRARLGEASQLVRRISRELRPSAVDRLGLVPAIAELAAQHTGNEFHVHLESTPKDPALTPAVEVAGYAIAAESIKNAAEHSHATKCWVKVTISHTMLTIVIEDNGTGLSLSPPGVGMTSMRERTEELGGTFNVGPRDAGGTRVEAALPLADRAGDFGADLTRSTNHIARNE